jgi:hypothetical protein
MNAYPTKESIELGLKLVAIVPGESVSPAAIAEESLNQMESFGKCQAFKHIGVGIHEQMCHSEPFAGNCPMQINLLFAIMAKMFLAGWSSGRQEIIDAEVSRIGKVNSGE